MSTTAQRASLSFERRIIFLQIIGMILAALAGLFGAVWVAHVTSSVQRESALASAASQRETELRGNRVIYYTEYLQALYELNALVNDHGYIAESNDLDRDGREFYQEGRPLLSSLRAREARVRMVASDAVLSETNAMNDTWSKFYRDFVCNTGLQAPGKDCARVASDATLAALDGDNKAFEQARKNLITAFRSDIKD
ncbi:MAG: hypothetical protein LCH82_04320 [Actinobacteria bacterium]|nr:hypothetical protein [Actinomycetota bacterium]